MYIGVVLSIRYHNAEGRSLRPLLGEPQSFAHRELESFAEVPQPVAEPVPVGAAG